MNLAPVCVGGSSLSSEGLKTELRFLYLSWLLFDLHERVAGWSGAITLLPHLFSRGEDFQLE